MRAGLEVGRARREYNKWVADETLEDYALRFTSKKARRWSPFRVANTAIGGISFLALEAIGGAITLTYGFTNAVCAILVVGAILFLMGMPVSLYAARFGVDIDLLSRGAGFGYLGSTITSLIYASFTFIFFALEAAIMAKALAMSLGVPEPVGFILSSLVVIPLVTRGFAMISRFQLMTQPIWAALQILPFVVLAVGAREGFFRDWTDFAGRLGHADGRFDLLLFGSAAGVVFALVAQIGEQVDYLRFLPGADRPGRNVGWTLAVISAGPGWAVLGTLKLLAGSLLAFLALRSGVPLADAGEPTHMYSVAFAQVTGREAAGLALAAIFVVICQIKINVTNAYAGSIAWSNFFSRLTHSHPGRVVWVVFNVFVALLLMELGIYRSLEKILGLYAHVAVAWMGAIVADLVISKPLGLSPPGIEFKRAHLYDINPVGLGAMAGGSLTSILAYLGVFGPVAAALSPFLALGVAMVLAPLIAWRTGGRYYLARRPSPALSLKSHCACGICENSFEIEDMAECPVDETPICSLFCTLNARCKDRCKKGSSVGEQFAAAAGQGIAARWAEIRSSNLVQYLALLCLVSAIIGGVMALVYWHSVTEAGARPDELGFALLKTFLGLFLITGIVAWLFVLAHQSREMAQQDSERQTELLLAEIAAHEQTDLALQAAKEVAEAANLAKSRYLVGISHEFRTPLNAILGYAQLIERGDLTQPRESAAIRIIRRSGEHLAGLVDGLLDVARIEAGRFELARDVFAFPEFIEQLADMFRLQAESKGVAFVFETPPRLPALVRADEKRLRQVLINLLSNAVKFTERGEVRFSIRIRNDVATFTVADSGVGISPEHFDRIFVPFERIESPNRPWIPGTGLGLTLTKLMTEMMGGAIRVDSRLGEGATFSVQLHLPVATATMARAPEVGRVVGYLGPARSILVIDDDESHRDLARDLLGPLGFQVATAAGGAAGLACAARILPDIVLLDVTMPDMDGWEVARALRALPAAPGSILMMSAAAAPDLELRLRRHLHDGFIVKPFQIEQLFDALGAAAGLTWTRRHAPRGAEPAPLPATLRARLADLEGLARLGLMRRLGEALAALREDLPESLYRRLSAMLAAVDLDGMIQLLEDMRDDRGAAG